MWLVHTGWTQYIYIHLYRYIHIYIYNIIAYYSNPLSKFSIFTPSHLSFTPTLSNPIDNPGFINRTTLTDSPFAHLCPSLPIFAHHHISPSIAPCSPEWNLLAPRVQWHSTTLLVSPPETLLETVASLGEEPGIWTKLGDTPNTINLCDKPVDRGRNRIPGGSNEPT